MNNDIKPIMSTLPNPTEDGVSHINIHYNLSLTKVGRMLSSYFVAPFKHPYFGPFRSIEGFTLYVKTGCCDDTFRNVTGAQAKLYYRCQTLSGKLVNQIIDECEQERIMMLAVFAKLEHNPVIATLLMESTLPFDYYYLFGSGKIPIRPQDGAVLTNSLMKLRSLMCSGQKPEPMLDVEYAKLIVR